MGTGLLCGARPPRWSAAPGRCPAAVCPRPEEGLQGGRWLVNPAAG